MGWRRMRVIEEVAPGIATMVADNRSHLRFTIKPGSYVWPERLRKG
jgi:hypothetical protein